MAKNPFAKLTIDTSAVTKAIADLNTSLKNIGSGVNVNMDGILKPVNNALSQ